MTIAENNQIRRATLLLNVPETGLGQLRHLSADIFTEIETAYPGDVLEMVMRADITQEDFDLVVTISASDMSGLNDITERVRSLAVTVNGSATVQRALVRFYNPSPATLAACYVTGSEAFNPPQGKNKQGTGFNAWG